MLFAVFLMSLLDVIAKILLDKFSVAQMTFLRGGFSLIILGTIGAIRYGINSFNTQIPEWHLLRTILMMISSFTFFAALALLPLVNVFVIVFVAPIVVAALSGPLLGEKVGVWRWSAVLIGFSGVLIILEPSTEFSMAGTIYGLIGVVTYALNTLTTRKLSSRESPLNLSFYIFFGPTILGAAISVFDWIAPNMWDWFLFFLTGLVGGFAFLFFNLALQKAEASFLASFEYTGLLWASLAGYFIFNEVVDSKIWLGATIIIFGGVIILYRESKVGKSIEN
jgi:drug/metabolite transporter (DMT)-like permease